MTKSEKRDELYETLLAEASNAKLLRSLERLKQACDDLEDSKIRITPAAVGKYCVQRWAGPKTQSIRNSQEVLFKYMKTRAAQQVLPVSERSKPFEPAIKDESIRAYVTLLKAELDEAVRTKNRLLSGLRNIPGIDVDALIATGFQRADPKPAVASSEDAAKAPKVKEEVRTAVARLLNADALASVGLELYRSRLRHPLTKKVLLEKEDVEALSSLMSANDKPPRDPQ